MLKQIAISKVSVLKQGASNGRNWTLYKYSCEDGFEFTSFEQRSSGPQEVDVEKKVNGKWENWSEVSKKKKSALDERVERLEEAARKAGWEL